MGSNQKMKIVQSPYEDDSEWDLLLMQSWDRCDLHPADNMKKNALHSFWCHIKLEIFKNTEKQMQQCHVKRLDFIYILYFFSHQEFLWASFAGYWPLSSFSKQRVVADFGSNNTLARKRTLVQCRGNKPALYFLCWRSICFFEDKRTDSGLMPCSSVLCSRLTTLLDSLSQILDTSVCITYHTFRWIQSWRVVRGGCFLSKQHGVLHLYAMNSCFSTLFTSYLTALHLPLHGKKNGLGCKWLVHVKFFLHSF